MQRHEQEALQGLAGDELDHLANMATNSKPALPTPHQSDKYEPGAIMDHSWGYDQTNIDWYMIVDRKERANGQTWLTLIRMTTGTVQDTAWMQGTCTPGHVKEGAKPFRRKLHKWDGRETGVAIKSYGWCSLWAGKPERWSSYA